MKVVHHQHQRVNNALTLRNREEKVFHFLFSLFSSQQVKNILPTHVARSETSLGFPSHFYL